MKLILTTMILCFVSLPMAACGVKPKSVDAPQGNDNDTFPHQYPSR
jgi:hypothetical protein